MKTKKHLHVWVKILFVLFLFSGISCDDSNIDEQSTADPISFTADKESQLNDFLNQIDIESDILLVSNESSINDAIEASSSGDVIYIQPGVYKETVNNIKKNVSLIALSNANEKVILENSAITISSLQTKQLKRRRSFITMSREDLGDNIAHYTFDVTLGPGEFDVVTIHRVIREHHSYLPVRTKGHVFMIHGAIQDFDDIFLTAGADVINAETSAPFYLASEKIDVWGIDLAWTKVPIETTDFSFMEGWGIEKDVDHTLTAMTIARLIRGFTGQGFCKMNLLGFSSGVHVAYGAAARETQIHPCRRDIKGLIPVENQIKFENQNMIDKRCTTADNVLAKLNNGMHHNPWGVGLINLGTMALNAPNDPSPVPDFAGLTNMQVMNAVGSSHAEGWHFFGGTPFELYYTNPMRFVNLSVALAPHMPRLQFYEMAASGCPSKDVSYDDHLEEIKIPIFYISAEGGDGPAPDYTASLTQSSDITRFHVVDETRETEFNIGHGDIWMAYNAKDLMWTELHNWLIVHK
jgi:hypothetical protein